METRYRRQLVTECQRLLDFKPHDPENKVVWYKVHTALALSREGLTRNNCDVPPLRPIVEEVAEYMGFMWSWTLIRRHPKREVRCELVSLHPDKPEITAYGSSPWDCALSALFMLLKRRKELQPDGSTILGENL